MAVEQDLLDTAVNPVRVINMGQVRSPAKPVGEFEPRPIPGNAGVDP